MAVRNEPRSVIVVTGAASGIGLASVRGLLDPEAVIVGVDVAGQPDDLHGPGLEWVDGDVAEAATWDEVVEVAKRHDPLGARSLVTCAGAVVAESFLETSVEDWRRLFEVNVLGVVRGLNALAPAMLERGEGSIAITCSVNSFIAEDTLAAYSTSKAALLQVARSAALEYAQYGLRINAVCPGAVDTPMLRGFLEALSDPAAVEDALARRIPTGEITRAEEVAAVLRFLVSPAASGLSGSAIVVDGGLTSTYDFEARPSRDSAQPRLEERNQEP
jgi:NAD(P)-dependent dehydrogenase (short-subunit alcohol dehydrogenase family)